MPGRSSSGSNTCSESAWPGWTETSVAGSSRSITPVRSSPDIRRPFLSSTKSVLEAFTEASVLRLCLPNTGWDPPLPPEPYFWPEYQRGPYRQYTEYGRCNTSAEIITDAGIMPIRHGRHAAPAGVPLADPAHGPVPVLAAQALMLRPGPYPNSRIYNMRRWWITVRVDEGILSQGDRIRVIYGDPREEFPGATVQRFPEDRLVFLAFVDLEGRGNFEEVSGSPVWFEVIAGPPERIQAVVPSIVSPSQPVRMRVAYTDRVEARPTHLPTEASLSVHVSGEAAPLARSHFSGLAGPGVIVEAPPPAAPVARFHVRDSGHAFEALTNPVVVRATGPRLFWGDLQHQSMYHGYNVEERKGISLGTPEEGYAYAREIAGLDFVAETNSGSFHRPEVWNPVRDAALAAYRPGEFVTFQAAEVGDNHAGHRCVYFRGSQPEPGVEGTLAQTAPRAMHDRYRGRHDVLLIPHHTKMWFSWDSWDSELEPVMEIHSVWGSSERPGLDRWPMRECQGGSAQAALARGYPSGLRGRLGQPHRHAGPGPALRRT